MGMVKVHRPELVSSTPIRVIPCGIGLTVGAVKTEPASYSDWLTSVDFNLWPNIVNPDDFVGKSYHLHIATRMIYSMTDPTIYLDDYRSYPMKVLEPESLIVGSYGYSEGETPGIYARIQSFTVYTQATKKLMIKFRMKQWAGVDSSHYAYKLPMFLVVYD